MKSGDEQFKRLKHQVTFLHERGLTSSDMDDWNRQLWLLERLVGKDPLKLDPQLRGRLHGELERATVAQLKAMDLMDAWLEAWEWRDEPADDEPAEAAPPTVPTWAPSSPRIPRR